MRSADRAYRSDPELDPLIAGSHDVAPLDPDRMREALLLTLAAPPLDLLSGGWKPKRSWAVDPALLRMAKRSEEHTSELQSLMRSSYAVFCLKKTQTDQPQ